MKKVVYIVSDINKALAFEWVAENIDKKRFALSFILLNPGGSALEDYLREQKVNVARVRCRGKKDWPAAVYQVYRLLRSWQPQVVHCHLIQATVIGLTAAWLAGVKNRIYTRHHSSLHHVYFKKGVWWDKLANKLATRIIAIAGMVKTILLEWEGADPEKVVLIPHGFKLELFDQVEPERVLHFRQRYNIEQHRPVIGVIARFTEWKGIQYIIPAFRRLLEKFPDAVLLLLNAQGDYEKELGALLKEVPYNSLRLIPFEKDIMAAYKAMDVFVHTPIDEHSEAFGQIYVEALAAKLPSVFTLSGIATDFIKDGRNGFVVPFKNSDHIYEKLCLILNNYIIAKETAKQGKQDVKVQYSLDKMIHSLEALYEQH